jgi:hypothetical protein
VYPALGDCFKGGVSKGVKDAAGAVAPLANIPFGLDCIQTLKGLLQVVNRNRGNALDALFPSENVINLEATTNWDRTSAKEA